MRDPELRPAVFLDRDGTLIEDRGHLRSPREVVFLPNTFKALLRLQERFLLFIVTNQSGVARGAIKLQHVESVNAHLISRLAEAGVIITATYVCPHQPADGCACIKPNPHFLVQAAAEYQLDLRGSFVVGDHPCDTQLARNAGARGVFVRTGHGLKHLDELADDETIVADIGAAAQWILSSGPA